MLKTTSKNETLRLSMARRHITIALRHILMPFFLRTQLSHIRSYLENVQQKLLYRSSFTKTRSICLLTGRSRSVYRSFHLSRIKLREYANAGYFTGLSKASW